MSVLNQNYTAVKLLLQEKADVNVTDDVSTFVCLYRCVSKL